MNLRPVPCRQHTALPGGILAAILLWMFTSVAAVADERLHEATVTVQDRDRPARQAGFERALDKVLVKISGDRQVLKDPRVEDLREQAGRYVQRFRYVDGGDGGPGLEVRFDGAALERLLTERGLPVWGASRPGLLVWLAAVQHGQRVIAGGDEGRGLVATLERVAEERGLRLVFPVMDLEDRSAVNFADLAGGFHEPVLRASERYSTHHVVAAYVQPRGSGWTGRWRLFGQEFREEHEARGDTLEEALDEGLQGLADLLGRRLAVAGLLPGEDHVQVVVEGVEGFDDYRTVHAHLAELSVVAELRLFRLEPDRAVFLARLRGGPRELQRGVRLGRVLEVADGPGDPAADAGLGVRLRLSR